MSPLCAHAALEQQELNVGWILQVPLEYKLLIISEKINALSVFSVAVYIVWDHLLIPEVILI